MIEGMRIITILLITTFSGSVGTLALKKGITMLPRVTFGSIFTNSWIYLGSFLYILSAITNILLFRFLDYSIAFPMTSLTYVWTVIISYFIFKEKWTLRKILAVAFIILGVFVISR